MDFALWKLLWLRQRGGLRRRLKGLRTARGLALTAIGIGFILFWIFGSSFLGPEANVANRLWSTTSVRTTATDVLPVLLLVSCLVTIATTTGPTIYFSPAEVNFLFAGPFSRRALLLYKFFSYALGAMITAFCLSLVMPHPIVAWAAAFVGTFLTLVFMQLFSTALGLLGQVAAARLYARLRWFLIALCLGIIIVTWWQTRRSLADGGLLAWLTTMQSSVGTQCLLAPFAVFTRVVVADNLADLLRWGAVAFAIDACLLGLVIWLDAEYYEAVQATSQRIHLRWQQYRRGRLFVAEAVVVDSHIPRLPRCGGVGPIFWRQLTTAWRTCRRSLMVLHLVGAGVGMVLASSVRQGLSPWTIVGLVMAVSVVILPRTLIFDFRGDVDHLAWLKVLPFRPMVTVIGQLLTPVLLATTIHWFALCGALCCTPPGSRLLLAVLAAAAMPVNFVHYSLENLIFLLSPSRAAPVGRVDFEFFGRTLVETMAKIFPIVVSLLIGFVAAHVVYTASGSYLPMGVAVFALVMTLQGSVIALIAAWTFKRFDVAERSLGDG